MPDGKPVAPTAKTSVPTTPRELSVSQYHILSDEWIEAALARLEELQDEREDVEVEYAVCGQLGTSVSVLSSHFAC